MLGLLAGVLLLPASACGRDAPPVESITQSMGVNADIGPDHRVKIRNLVVISRVDGRGWISASLLASRGDALTSVTGTVSDPGNPAGVPLVSNLHQPLPLRPGDLVVLTERPVIRVRSPLLRSGAAVQLTLQFARAGELEILVPVYRHQDAYVTITPVPRDPDAPPRGDAGA